MRVLLGAVCLTLTVMVASAQVEPKQPSDSSHSTGRTVSPETEGKQQPQGPTGPLNTTTGGAPAESPQGQTPPGMQSAPDGSSKTIVDPKSSAQPAPNQTAKDPVPPATDKSEATRSAGPDSRCSFSAEALARQRHSFLA